MPPAATKELSDPRFVSSKGKPPVTVNRVPRLVGPDAGRDTRYDDPSGRARNFGSSPFTNNVDEVAVSLRGRPNSALAQRRSTQKSWPTR